MAEICCGVENSINVFHLCKNDVDETCNKYFTYDTMLIYSITGLVGSLQQSLERLIGCKKNSICDIM
jgi:hypothetical protein